VDVDCDVLTYIDYCDFPHILWKKLWEIYGDHDTPPFLDDHDSKFHSLDQVSHVDMAI
jgi:hypothetical protein